MILATSYRFALFLLGTTNTGRTMRPKIVANSGLVPYKLKRHMEGNQSDLVRKREEIFKRNLSEKSKFL